jgi:A/G-specific adenine glycosylase
VARDVSTRLRRWYRRHHRDLPWRRTRDPYKVLVSELMLQQTQVSRVVDYYERFLYRFPTMAHVADAPPRRVMEAWSGLGYYARARNLHALSREVMRERNGKMPSDTAALRTLPGVGAYTAGAIASFAHEQRVPLVDTNVERVLVRVFAPGLDLRRAAAKRHVWSIAEAILPRTGRATWTHNQAVMELGALVCTARVRRCDACPLRTRCTTFAAQSATDATASAASSGGRASSSTVVRQAPYRPAVDERSSAPFPAASPPTGPASRRRAGSRTAR